MPSDDAKCDGKFCGVKHQCLRYSGQIEDGQETVDNPQTEGEDDVRCDAFIFTLKKGDRGKFFHPFAFGVMYEATVERAENNLAVSVLFDFKHNGRRSFRVPPNYN